ncbi:MAG: glycosyltransferase family 2 protein [Lachnospiraceae bacterium]|nr:glycosyltransferase family 2 protein [Lachnospiraceae bacterium]
MVTVSLCMIVKNEEKVLDRCLSSMADLMDEIIIVDTGSTDRTKEVAKKYTDKIYDFPWVDDFSLARNFAFKHAVCDYIYSADADEILDEENRRRFLNLKSVLMSEVEIVQMWYVEKGTQTVLNAKKEYRPKLFKRLRTFQWIDPIHETVRTEPVVFDSDIEIFHMPEGNHSKRDFRIFELSYDTEGKLSKRLYEMYARELYKWGTVEDLSKGEKIFKSVMNQETLDNEMFLDFCTVIARAERLLGNTTNFMKYAMKVVSVTPNSEICKELGDFYFTKEDYSEAALWYYNAIHETESSLDINSQGKATMVSLSDCYEKLGQGELSAHYLTEAGAWKLPEE